MGKECFHCSRILLYVFKIMQDRFYHGWGVDNNILFISYFCFKVVGIMLVIDAEILLTHSFVIDFAQASIFTVTPWTPMLLEGRIRRGGGLRLSRIHGGFWTSTAPQRKGLSRGVLLSLSCLSHTARLQAVCLRNTSRLRVVCHCLLSSLALACIVAPSMWKPSMMMLLSILQDHSLKYVHLCLVIVLSCSVDVHIILASFRFFDDYLRN